MSIATGTGDRGGTQVGNERLSKDSPEVEALGALDELGAAIGFARSLTSNPMVRRRAEEIQRELFEVAAGIGASGPTRERSRLADDDRAEALTSEIVGLESGEGMLRDWALPGGHAAAAAFDVARTACRRAERALVHLARHANPGGDLPEEARPVSAGTLRYVNRLSDLLWLYARVIEREAGVAGALRDSG